MLSFSAPSSMDPNKHLELTEMKPGNFKVLLFVFFKCSPFTKQATTMLQTQEKGT